MIEYKNVNRIKFVNELSNVGIEMKLIQALDDSAIGCKIEFAENTDMEKVNEVLNAHDITEEKQLSEIEQIKKELLQTQATVAEMQMNILLNGGAV